MKKLKGQGKLTKLITSRIATSNRDHFSNMVYDVEQLKQMAEYVNSQQAVDLKIVSFSSSKDYPEQVLSILSFLRHVGTPLSWTIYSDGSHSDREVDIIQAALPVVQLIRENVGESYFETDKLKSALQPYKSELYTFAQVSHFGRRLSLYLNHTIDKPTLFLDADIVFYKKISTLKTSFESNHRGWFLPEEGWTCLDSRYMASNKPEHYQANGGFFLMNKELTNLHDGFHFLKSLKQNYEYFSDQTVIHILLNANQYMPLDPRLFVLDSRDQFDFSYAFKRDTIALRHYTGPVRHKMWQRDWKWHLSLT